MATTTMTAEVFLLGRSRSLDSDIDLKVATLLYPPMRRIISDLRDVGLIGSGRKLGAAMLIAQFNVCTVSVGFPSPGFIVV
jgi:hypothetical protein